MYKYILRHDDDTSGLVESPYPLHLNDQMQIKGSLYRITCVRYIMQTRQEKVEHIEKQKIEHDVAWAEIYIQHN